MSLNKKTGSCTICKKTGRTDWHHIISQHHARRTGQNELISDPNNVIELCRSCHDQTTASMVRKRLTREGKSITRKKTVKRPTRKKTTVRVSRKQQRINIEKSELEKKKTQEEIIDKSIENLEARGVYESKPPSFGRIRTNHHNYLIDYLKNIRLEDPIAEKWSDFFQVNPSSNTQLQKLYPLDHWLHNSSLFDPKKSQEWEDDGFCWIKNGFSWREGLSLERSQYEIKLSKIRTEERNALEQLQLIAVNSEKKRILKLELEQSIESMTERGVYFSDSPVNTYQELYNYLSSVSIFDELAIKWIDNFNQSGMKDPLPKLYPKDHWLHNSEIFDPELSSNFENDGFCWTPNGGAWKNNLSLKQTKAEINLAKIRNNEKQLMLQEDERLEKERSAKEKIDLELNSIQCLKDREVFLENSPVNDIIQLPQYIQGMCLEEDVAKKWSEYFNEFSREIFAKIYPKDHWLHNSEKFDEALSSEFENDGFVWTNNGGIWKRDLSLQQAKAELRIASIKLQQKQVLEREQANLERMREK